jgi:hypothetical protein
MWLHVATGDVSNGLNLTTKYHRLPAWWFLKKTDLIAVGDPRSIPRSAWRSAWWLRIPPVKTLGEKKNIFLGVVLMVQYP